MTITNPLCLVNEFGQSFWLDDLRRDLITSGELKRLIEEDCVRGLTSNPTIFQKAIMGSTDYDEQIRQLNAQQKSVEEVYEGLVLDDIRAAADLFYPLYIDSQGGDGYVSIEVSPRLAYDTEGTIQEAMRFWKEIDRPNIMIKIPATHQGVPAVERVISEGINVNVTLIFSLERYQAVVDAYLKGLRTLQAKGGDVSKVASVASFFVSRVDVAIDKLLEEKIAAGAEVQGLLGKAAIANAALAYEIWEGVFGGERFADLKALGAKSQRLLWASTGTKNPNYRDVLYVEELIGVETVDTLPPATLKAFKDHGVARATLVSQTAQAHATSTGLQAAGIDMQAVTQQLEDEGVKSFSASFEDLINSLAAKREVVSV
ncbi:transaldolase [Candidatus Cyanaurora vandensis]|uniref:transaldolase n=1 Tax=Candidatus Cyanaurora vandensis TaxID=2714958 RepID=UPI002581059B|nr:transaldolase [Candidatus Cyanaurora vandensis]